MIAQSQIREKISRYLRHEISLDQFEDWLVQRSWNMHKDSEESAQKLAAAVELRLAEHSSGHLDDDALRKELRSLIDVPVVSINFGEISGEAVFFSQNNEEIKSARITLGRNSLVYPVGVHAGT